MLSQLPTRTKKLQKKLLRWPKGGMSLSSRVICFHSVGLISDNGTICCLTVHDCIFLTLLLSYFQKMHSDNKILKWNLRGTCSSFQFNCYPRIKVHTVTRPQGSSPLTHQLLSGICPLHLGTVSQWWSSAHPLVIREGLQGEVNNSHSSPPLQDPQWGFQPPGRNLDGEGSKLSGISGV